MRIEVDEEAAYWKRYRAYVRQRIAARMWLICLPVWFVFGFLWALQTSGYTPGDPRSDLLWRLGVSLAFDVFFLAGAFYSARWLLADRRGEKRPRRDRPRPE
jgi:hypothetical protein